MWYIARKRLNRKSNKIAIVGGGYPTEGSARVVAARHREELKGGYKFMVFVMYTPNDSPLITALAESNTAPTTPAEQLSDIDAAEYVLHLTPREAIRKWSRQHWAETLILKLPDEHEGRNDWLLNYGVSITAQELRKSKGLYFSDFYKAACSELGDPNA